MCFFSPAVTRAPAFPPSPYRHALINPATPAVLFSCRQAVLVLVPAAQLKLKPCFEKRQQGSGRPVCLLPFCSDTITQLGI
jgi:hypothetical protein